MKLFNRLLIATLAVLLFAPLAGAQQKPEPAEDALRDIPVKVKVVLAEYSGTKEVSSLPYTIAVMAAAASTRASAYSEARGGETHLRMGVRVPIATGTFNAGSGAMLNTQFQYQDVGTNIDCWALALADGRYQVHLTVSDSSVYASAVKGGTEGAQPEKVRVNEPSFRSFRVENTLILRDGQTDESTVASDPSTGHLLRVSVSLHVVKNP